MKLTAKQNAARWAILQCPATDGDCTHVDGLTVEIVEALVAAGYCDLDERQNDSPTTAEFLDFMRAHPGVFAHGYVIGPRRDDARVTLEGLAYVGKPSRKLLMDATYALRHADEFDISNAGMRCWWD